MAYLRGIGIPKCASPGCAKRAAVVLVDCWNGVRSSYCKPHGDRALKKQNEAEASAHAADQRIAAAAAAKARGGP